MNPAERRMREWEFRRQRRWSFAAAILCLLVVVAFGAEFVYARAAAAPPPAKGVTVIGEQIRIPLSEFSDSTLHYYTADANNTVIRFFVVRKPNGDYVAALDACQICGTLGYRQEGQNVICRNCAAAIYIPSIGEKGGCNPIAVKSIVEGGEIRVDLSALTDAISTIHSR